MSDNQEPNDFLCKDQGNHQWMYSGHCVTIDKDKVYGQKTLVCKKCNRYMTYEFEEDRPRMLLENVEETKDS